MPEDFSTLVEGLEILLWKGTSNNSWLRSVATNRVLSIDDQWTGRVSFFSAESEHAPQTSSEKYFRDWLNVEFDFFPMPDDYQYSPDDSQPKGDFSEEWFEQTLLGLENSYCAILLDMMFGDEESGVENASGVKFLRIIRRHFPNVPVLVVSNLPENRNILERLKKGDHPDHERNSSFDDYVAKGNTDNPEESVFERIAHKLVRYGNLSDPGISAFSPPMRLLAKTCRQIVLDGERMSYESATVSDYPTPVTIIGEWGSGKNFIADYIQRLSPRKNNPYQTVTFTDVSNDDTIKKLFGVGPYTDAPETIHTDIRNGAVMKREPRGKRTAFPEHVVALGGVGVLQTCDMGAYPQGGGREPQPKLGTVVLDELGAAPARVQQTLLSVFNHGKFTPENTPTSIPTQRSLDLLFLIPCTPKAFENLVGDIKSRLMRTRIIKIPQLSERQEDLLPLVMYRLGDKNDEHPVGRVFTKNGYDELCRAARTCQFRGFLGLIQELVRQTRRGGRQFLINEGDVAKACEQARATHINGDHATGKQIEEPEDLPGTPIPKQELQTAIDDDDLERTAEMGKTELFEPFREHQLNVYMKRSIETILDYVDWAIEKVESSVAPGHFPVVQIYRLLSGESHSTLSCKSRFIHVLTFDEETTKAKLAASTRIRRLVEAVKDRNKGLGGWLDDVYPPENLNDGNESEADDAADENTET